MTAMISEEKLRLLAARSKEGRALPKTQVMLGQEILELRAEVRFLCREYNKLKKFVTDEQRTQALIS